MARRNEPEPLSVDADTVVEFLKRHGQHQSALLVAHLGRSAQVANKENMRLLERIQQLKEQYEPPVVRPRPRDYTPPPEATD